jgi:MYXO-CTERM domain-containing protein
MQLAPLHRAPRHARCAGLVVVLVGIVAGIVAAPRTAHAWAIGSQLNETGCHEPITAAALRAVRARFSTAPVLPPSRDEAALIDDVVFSPPDDFVGDLAGISLLLGVRDNDLKGIDPLSSLDLIQVHGNPETQDEHCIRGPNDDGSEGDLAAIAACRAFIAQTASDALDGLDASGNVDPSRRTELALYVAIRGRVTPQLPLFYVKIGAAVHALEDGFPHTYRTADGSKITTVLNWIDLVGGHYDEARDGPGHRAELDRCWDASDPTIHRNYELATQAATDLLAAALDPGLTREQKVAQFDAVTAHYLGYQPGCTAADQWCDPPEAHVTNALACNASGSRGFAPWSVLALAGLFARRRRRARGDALRVRPLRDRAHRDRGRGRSAIAVIAAALTVAGLAGEARAQPEPAAPAPAPAPSPTAPAPTAPAVDPETAPPPPATVPVTPTGKEPGRDVKTPTPAETAAVRADKQLGSRWGFAVSGGASVDRAALVGTIGLRYRIEETWLVGLDAGWNPWITTSPMTVHAGVATLAGTLIRRFPMKFDRVNLRSSLHLGASTLLFDVFGAPKYSIGPYGSLSPLGLDYDLGNSVRIVWDPIEIAMPVPLLGQLPLYYEQFRMVIGIQIGS